MYLVGVFFWVSHRLLRIHSPGLASLVSIQHPMGPGLIHSLRGNGDGTVVPKWSGERGATAVFRNWNLYVGLSCISFTLNWVVCCLWVVTLVSLLCSKIHQVNGKEKDFKASQTCHPSSSQIGPPWGYQIHNLFRFRPYWKWDFQVWEQNRYTGWLRCLLTEFTYPLLTMSNCLFIHKVKCSNLKMLKQLQRTNSKNYS